LEPVHEKDLFCWISGVLGVIVNVMGILGGVGAVVQGTPYYLISIFAIFGALSTAPWFILIRAQPFRHGNRLCKGAVG
jgi:hypothetical protein